MYSSIKAVNELSAAAEQGRICALSADCHRYLQECPDAYPGLFPESPFDPRLFSAVALANAFGSPWATADQLRIATRTSLWVFAADWVVDYVAKSRDEVHDVMTACLAIADGRAPAVSTPLTDFLADIRDELATAPTFAAFHPNWRDQLERYLAAMAREWDWKSARAAGDETKLPTFEEYLGNADNFGSSWVNVSHWIFTCDPHTLDQLDELWLVSEEVQKVLRLLNDLATHERDLSWGDLNGLMLGVDRAGVNERIAVLVDGCQELLQPLRESHPREVVYLERQIGYSTGFYGNTDYWGAL
ncbi:MAG: hypothetical protein JWN52_7720 [Actinomycetia bacterium]|nr:hypothetical protein [Actinomycetes bacterium]